MNGIVSKEINENTDVKSVFRVFEIRYSDTQKHGVMHKGPQTLVNIAQFLFFVYLFDHKVKSKRNTLKRK
jgi:hypothetical protein